MAPRLSLAEQIADLEDTAPPDFDIEDINAGDDLDGDVDRSHYRDVGPSSLKRMQLTLHDLKYEGVKTTRKQMFEDDDESMDSEVEEDDKEANDDDEEDTEEETHPQYPPAFQELPSQSDSEGEEKGDVPDAEHINDISTTLKITREQDRKKGMAVTRQLAFWDNLLDARIRLQKSVTASNRLPSSPELEKLSSSEGYQSSLSRMLEEATLLSKELFDLHENILTANGPISPPPRKRQRLNEEPDLEANLLDASQLKADLDHALHPYLIQTLNKWSAKIQAVAPSILLPANRNAFSKSSQNIKSAVELIEENMADQMKLLSRTQVYRGKGDRLGIPIDHSHEDEKPDEEIFDDTDFYQQLLRDVIDSQGKGSEDWIVAQKQRKAKKKVDTKASKGRKIRYDVHDKLHNFMVPIPVSNAWEEDQIDELFSSLLGRGAERQDTTDGLRRNAELLKGFKLFG